MAKRNKVPEFLKMANDLKKNASRYAASESVKFFKESFVKGGFTDSSFLPWKKSKTPLSGKRTLYKTGELMQSIRKKKETLEEVIIEADSDHGQIHNNGGYIVVTTAMKRFFWAKYYSFKGRNSEKAAFCKAMALMKTGKKIKIPKRQFMGESKVLMDNFKSFFEGRINIAFKQYLNNK